MSKLIINPTDIEHVQQNATHPDKDILRMHILVQKLGISKSTIYNFLKPTSKYFDPEFPKPIRIGLRATGWSKIEINAWLEKKQNTNMGGR
ncbi:AlpA family phage regulatory protein [Alteromonas sp. 5E99-2]|uniref:helix-turn-helix transcriptional regulator n=1 Tax=Alteromonas sp. 5E99-2 TaxID=2817683 RepID=UPI001A9824DC|nr:AlpA family phage regulatory protein [Alteromonas sp. 5E99-2]MBO1254900.1 AlpA family phage regulatory protein [Alteromonas sp. 5E99-2]